MNEGSVLRKVSQTQKDECYLIPLIRGTQNKSNSEKQKVRRWLPRAGGGGEWELLFNELSISIWDEEKVLDVGGGDGCATVWMY